LREGTRERPFTAIAGSKTVAENLAKRVDLLSASRTAGEVLVAELLGEVAEDVRDEFPLLVDREDVVDGAKVLGDGKDDHPLGLRESLLRFDDLHRSRSRIFLLRPVSQPVVVEGGERLPANTCDSIAEVEGKLLRHCPERRRCCEGNGGCGAAEGASSTRTAVLERCSKTTRTPRTLRRLSSRSLTRGASPHLAVTFVRRLRRCCSCFSRCPMSVLLDRCDTVKDLRRVGDVDVADPVNSMRGVGAKPDKPL
jgi:hypothetical protein